MNHTKIFVDTRKIDSRLKRKKKVDSRLKRKKKSEPECKPEVNEDTVFDESEQFEN